MRSKKTSFNKRLLASVVASTALAGFSSGSYGQAAGDQMLEEVVVTGIRGALQRSMDMKRDSTGVVDAINAEDMGKFPDTNLAESLQRITGVSIDRVNGEGSEVTVRGFGGGFNLVTLNGRQMPTTNVSVIGGDQIGDFATGAGRSFDFGNLASEGVSSLEVFKTGRANSASGGIGATVNINTMRPLDNPGLQGSIGFKAMHDTSVEFEGSDFTPEVSGLVSWTDDTETWGVSFFGSYQERNNASTSATVNGWDIRSVGAFTDPDSGYVTGNTNIQNLPESEQLIAIPADSRWHLAESERERLNAQLAVQFRPMDDLTLTADFTYANNDQTEQRVDQTNWFNRPFNEVIFDDNPVVATPIFLQENVSGTKDTGFETQRRGMENTLESFGFNADWQVNDDFNLVFDFHTSSSESTPNIDGVFGAEGNVSSVLTGIAAPVVDSHSLNMATGFPQQDFVLDDANQQDRGEFGGTNANGVLDAGDLGSQMGRTIASRQFHDVDQLRLNGTWEFTDGARIDVGIDYRESDMLQSRTETQQTLGDWGIDNPGDVDPSTVEQYCLACLFSDFETNATGDSLVAFRPAGGDSRALHNALTEQYVDRGNSVDITNVDFNRVEEDIFGVFAQVSMEGEIAGLPTQTTIGVRAETTDVTSTSTITLPSAIIWEGDNDFRQLASDEEVPSSATGSYNNLLPSLDFQVELTQDVTARASFSQTIGRPGYGSLFAQDSAGNPSRPTALGGIPSGTAGNPGLEPLESNNFDVSVEWYYAPDSYVSVGAFEKRVKNFEGSGQTTRQLFDLRDPSSGAVGTRSGQAREAIRNIDGAQFDGSSFHTMTALIDNFGLDDAISQFTANLGDDGVLNQTFVTDIFSAYDVVANEDDPFFEFEVTQPINDRDARIWGFEFAVQHFFGDSGFGVQANYTSVSGDIGLDVGADPDEDQFALTGLSDTANLVLMYEDHGFSGRLAYNWRDDFLQSTNRGGGFRNPVFVESYGQLDMNLSYDVTDDLMITFEGINLTGENLRHHGRSEANLWFMQELSPRYLIGARYTF